MADWSIFDSYYSLLESSRHVLILLIEKIKNKIKSACIANFLTYKTSDWQNELITYNKNKCTTNVRMQQTQHLFQAIKFLQTKSGNADYHYNSWKIISLFQAKT